jgi:predicted metallopeptidase
MGDCNMRFRYERAPDVQELLVTIIDKLNFLHIPKNRVYCYRSYGSKSQNTIARVHSLPRIWQQALSEPPYYAVEVLAEQYDRLPPDEKEKTLIHELLHIPKSFGGGFRHHKNWVTKRRVELLHRTLRESNKLSDSNCAGS